MKIIGLCYPPDIWPETIQEPVAAAGNSNGTIEYNDVTLWRGFGPFILMDIAKMMAIDTDEIEVTTKLM